VEARALCDELGLEMVRSRTVGTLARFVTMLRMLVEERIGMGSQPVRASVGMYGPSPDVCPEGCCPPPVRPASSKLPSSRPL
jgi:ferrochelatase